MRKSILLFVLLLAAIVLLKVNESSNDKQLDNSTVEEFVSESSENKIAKN